jgi:transcriptional regulator with PAS, ATPase and Fis domain
MSDPVELQSLVESHEYPFIVIGKDYRVVAVNAAYSRSFNVLRADVLGQPCHQVLHQRDRPCNEFGEECPYVQSLITEQPCSCLHTHFDGDGCTRWVRINTYPIKTAGGQIYVGETLREIAARDGSRATDDLRPAGHSLAFLQTMEQLEQAAKTDAPVLLTGESGTGKELAADFIHRHSRRRNHPYVTVDCTAITDSLFESELFGHERGAFTGSVGAKRGLFEVADQGTVFLDEIGEASQKMQAKLLRVLETGEFRRVGSNRIISANLRFICATNRPLWESVQAKEFREDLYYRIACFHVRIPNLRDRLEDIPPLAAALLRQIGSRDNRSYRIDDQALEVLLSYHYPGNIRELRNILQVAIGEFSCQVDGVVTRDAISRALLSCDGFRDQGRFTSTLAPDLQQHSEECALGPLFLGRPTWSPAQGDGRKRKPVYTPSIERIEAHHIAQLLSAHLGSRRRVATALGISERTLYRKLSHYDLK